MFSAAKLGIVPRTRQRNVGKFASYAEKFTVTRELCRPENFPMDIVMFTGKMRLSWFIEERPVEYERMVAEGTLDTIIVEPPSLRFRVFARIFGFIAYFTGLFLVIAIFITLFTVKH